MSIEVGTSLIPGTANTPLDARCRVTAISDIPNIANPFLGMEIFCIANGKTYKVISLKSKMIGSMSVANGAVDEYEEIPDATALAALEKRVEDLEGGSGGTAGEEGEGTNSSPETVTATISTLMLTKPENGLYLIIRKAGSDGTRANSTIVIDTLNVAADRQKVKGYLDSVEDGCWTVCPDDGFSTPYDGAGIAVDLSAITDIPCTLFYCWATDAETFSDWQSLTFPCCGGGSGSESGGGSYTVEFDTLSDADKAMLKGDPGKDGKDGKDGEGLHLDAQGTTEERLGYPAPADGEKTTVFFFDDTLALAFLGKWDGSNWIWGKGIDCKGPQGNPGKTNYIFCLCLQSPPSLFDGLIWVKGGSKEPHYIAASGGINVLTTLPDSLTDIATGTIIITEE